MSRRRRGPPRGDALRFVLDWTGMIGAVLRDVGVPFGDIEDLTQEIIVKAWLAAKDGRLNASNPAAVRVWVKVVASRLGARFAHRARRAPPRDDLDVAEDIEADGSNIAQELLDEMRAATTPERWRVWLALTQGASLKELAAEEHLPIGTVATRVRLARRDFAAAIVRERAREQAPVRRKARKKGDSGH